MPDASHRAGRRQPSIGLLGRSHQLDRDASLELRIPRREAAPTVGIIEAGLKKMCASAAATPVAR